MLKIVILLFSLNIEAASKLNWDDCVREVLKINPDIKGASENMLSAGYLRKAAFSGFMPQVSANLNYNQGYVFSTSGFSSTLYSANVSASLNLFSGFRTLANLDKTAANKDISSLNMEITKANLSFELKNAFAGLLYAQTALKLTEDIIKRRTDNYRMVELRFDSGGENRGSLLLSKAYLTQAEYDNLQARQNMEIYRAQIAKLMGIQEQDGLEVYGEIPEPKQETAPIFSSILFQTTDYRMAVAQKDAAQADLKTARSQFYPSLNLTGSTGKQGPEWFPDNSRWSIGLSLSFPLFSGGNDYYNLMSSSSLLSQAELNIETLIRQTDTKLRQAYAGYLIAAKKYESDSDMLKAMSVQAEIARNKYGNGLLTFENWDIIESNLINTQKTVILSYRNKATAYAQWEQAQGKGAFQ